jgi:hypothetical protein
MRKILIVMVWVLLLMVSVISTEAQELKISFTPTEINGAHYSPNHIFAVWIKDSNNNYIKTLMIYAGTRKSYLYTWKSSSGGDVTDAITGATVSSFNSYTITWNLKDYKNNNVTGSSFKLCMEMTSDHVQGPYREIDFSTLGGDFTTIPADGENFKNITLTYTAGTTGTGTTFQTENYLKIFPNPSTGYLYADIRLEQSSETIISVYNLNNRLMFKKILKLEEGLNHLDLSEQAQWLASGNYLLLVETNHYTIGNKFLVR